MRIAFYAPLKAPDHLVPSGDRQMARLLVEALEACGHIVELASSLRAFCATPDEAHYSLLTEKAEREVEIISQSWQRNGAPDLWFTYHPYYKAPDLLGPRLTEHAGIPYLTAEASYSERRSVGVWHQTQDLVVNAVKRASANICFTERDQLGLLRAVPQARLIRFPPFIKPVAVPREQNLDAPRLVTVAMMRSGDKLESYRMLATSLSRIMDRRWTLTIVGAGPAQQEVQQLFADIPPERLQWLGQVAPETVPALLARGDIYVWPGFGEAYGLAYLEAAAAGLPVVAQRVAGVPEAVRDGESGLLVPPDDIDAFASAIAQLLDDTDLRGRLGAQGLAFVNSERSLNAAVIRLNAILKDATNG